MTTAPTACHVGAGGFVSRSGIQAHFWVKWQNSLGIISSCDEVIQFWKLAVKLISNNSALSHIALSIVRSTELIILV